MAIEAERAIAMFGFFVRNEEAATAIEYALIAGTLSITIYGAVLALGLDLLTLWNSVAAAF